MKVHWFQHVEFEGLGLIESWLRARGHEVTATRWWAGETAGPDTAAAEWLIVMGGPMNIYQHRDFPWLVDEKAAIAAAMDRGARVLGVCLGAQLIADVLGGKVMQNPAREIGWWPLRAVAATEARASRYAFPAELTVLHWHGDTFTLPPGAVRLAESEGCAQQAFAWGERVLALQFHLEMGGSAVAEIAAACADELAAGGRWVQAAGVITEGAYAHAQAASGLLAKLLAAQERA
ncbi:MAG: type 1 glutamine amidotransferase [Verrucomicrobia bacterium]|nr:type 1 glutamine amidotransferase [Verrucomicrobiota bacterium]